MKWILGISIVLNIALGSLLWYSYYYDQDVYSEKERVERIEDFKKYEDSTRIKISLVKDSLEDARKEIKVIALDRKYLAKSLKISEENYKKFLKRGEELKEARKNNNVLNKDTLTVTEMEVWLINKFYGER